MNVNRGAGAVGVFALHEVRNAAGKFNNLNTALDVALGVGDGLSVFG